MRCREEPQKNHLDLGPNPGRISYGSYPASHDKWPLIRNQIRQYIVGRHRTDSEGTYAPISCTASIVLACELCLVGRGRRQNHRVLARSTLRSSLSALGDPGSGSTAVRRHYSLSMGPFSKFLLARLDHWHGDGNRKHRIHLHPNNATENHLG